MKAEKGAFAARQRHVRLMMSLVMQAALFLVILVASVFVDGGTRWLYLWALLVPAGFTLVYLAAHRRGEAARASGAWTVAWEKAETRRNYTLLAAVGLVWLAGSVAILLLS